MKTKPNYAKRSRILGVDTSGDYVRVGYMDLGMLHLLKDEGFLDLDQTQNDSPTVAEFIEFLEKHPGAFAHGYTIGSDRDDARVSLEGLACHANKVTPTMLKDFITLCRHADEFSIEDGLRSWWD